MSTLTRSAIALVLAVVIGGAIYGAYQYPKAGQVVGSAVGSTFSTAKIAAIDMVPSTRAATSTSILNSDASGRWVTDSFVDCNGDTTAYTDLTGAGLAALTMKIATTSTTGIGLAGNTNYAANMTLSTSTTFVLNATSTAAASAMNQWWPTGTYLTFLFNATTTATGACVVGVHYIGS